MVVFRDNFNVLAQASIPQADKEVAIKYVYAFLQEWGDLLGWIMSPVFELIKGFVLIFLVPSNTKPIQ